MSAGVLIVEDEPLLRSMAVEFLSEAGLVTFEAENATDAIDLLNRRAPEVAVLFTDVRMPGSMDGLELARVGPQPVALDTRDRHVRRLREALGQAARRRGLFAKTVVAARSPRARAQSCDGLQRAAGRARSEQQSLSAESEENRDCGLRPKTVPPAA
jgi:chemotaxis response regulator CheB